ncbi:MAG: 2-ketoisovalerate ferredoxin oxidoreductase [Spirochaetaceae bacterium]|nr:MAG: 2-ketoisovalerate ferredoxin oxidoreductase [Spirochaetaceae bacterium]
MIKHKKPDAFYDTFERKGAGQQTTHYCPGCGHGTVHKMIAEAIDEFGVRDRTIFCSPVGCSVFAYYYFDTGNIQCAHGRAPAVATGMRRVHDDAVIISYQGDGDLAGIGTAEIIHAANRGENITVFFVNNAIYGMTGGQMAPTTLIGQQTLTTPTGRSAATDGNPIGMCELMSALSAPVYVERVSLGDGNRVLKARRAVRKALKNQIDGVGFSFVEILSPCPINWKLTPMDARKWLIENLEPAFPVKSFRDTGTPGAVATARAARDPSGPIPDDEMVRLLGSQSEIETIDRVTGLPEQRVKVAGFGGQGVLSAGILLANCAISEGLHATWLPSYGPEMRGGTANASVIVSEESIGSPLVDEPTTLIALNGPSIDAFEGSVVPGGLIVANSSLIDREPARSDVRYCMIPASKIAQDIGFQGAANVVLLAAYAAIEGFPAIDILRRVIPHALKKKNLVDLNLQMVDAAVEFVAEHPVAAPSAAPLPVR